MKPAAELEIRPVGDSVIIVEVGERDALSPVVIDEVLRAAARIRNAAIAGVTEVTTAFSTVVVFYDPPGVVAVDPDLFESLTTQIRAALTEENAAAPSRQQTHSKAVEIPVCYDAEFAPDLDAVARHTNLPAAEVVRRHASAEYRVACVGFTPGFPYLSGLPAELSVPRHATPRAQVAAGSVAIGGEQTGVYPTVSPGGWNIIGRTPLSLFDISRSEPALLAAGDRVRLRQIDRGEFERLTAEQSSAKK